MSGIYKKVKPKTNGFIFLKIKSGITEWIKGENYKTYIYCACILSDDQSLSFIDRNKGRRYQQDNETLPESGECEDFGTARAI